MKLLRVILCVLYVLSMHAEQPILLKQRAYKPRALHVPGNFGKTNFILGMPREGIPTTQAVEHEQAHGPTINDAFFSPDDDLQQKLISYIEQEQSAIYLAIFSFTDKDIAQALCQAKQRGVRVEVVIDIGCLSDRFSKVSCLRDGGIAIYMYDPSQSAKHGTYSNIMHNKFVIFEKNKHDQALVWTGSFNFTKSARFSNQENVVVTSESTIVTKFKQQFSKLKNRTLLYDGKLHKNHTTMS